MFNKLRDRLFDENKQTPPKEPMVFNHAGLEHFAIAEEDELDVQAVPSRLQQTSDTESEREEHLLENLSHDQILMILHSLKGRYRKYKARALEFSRENKELAEENKIIKKAMTESQDKSLRRMAELKEQCQLEQQAKAHLEDNLQTIIEEKEQMIQVLNTKIKLLKEGGTSEDESNLIDLSTPIENSSLVERVKRQEHLLSKCKETIQKNKERNVQLQQEKEQMAHQLEESSSKLSEALSKDEADHLKNELERMKRLHEESVMAMAETKHNMHVELEHRERQAAVARDDLATLRKQAQDAEEQLKNQKATIKAFQDQLADLEQEKMALRVAHQHEKVQFNKIKISLEESLKSTSVNLEKTINQLREDLSKETQHVVTVKSKNNDLNTKLKNVQDEVSNFQQLQRSKEEEETLLQAKLTEKENLTEECLEKIKHLEADIIVLEHNMSTLNKELNSRNNELETKQQQIEAIASQELQNKTKETDEKIQSLLKEIDEFKEQNSNLKQEMAEKEENLKNLQEETKSSCSKIQLLEEEIQTTKTELNSLCESKLSNEKEIVQLTETLKDIQSQKEKLEEQSKQSQNKSVKRLNADLKTLKQEMQQKDEIVKNLEVTLTEKKEQFDLLEKTSKDKVSELQDKIISKDDEYKKFLEDESKKNNFLKESLEDNVNLLQIQKQEFLEAKTLLEGKLIELEASLRDKEGLIRSIKADYEHSNSETLKMKEDLKSSSQGLEKELHSKEEKLAHQISVIKEQEEQISSLKKIFNDLKQQETAIQEEFKKQEETIHRMKSESDLQNSNLLQEVEQNNSTISSLNSQLESLMSEYQTVDKDRKDKETKLNELKKTLEVKSKELTSSKEKSEKKITKLKEQFQKKDSEIAATRLLVQQNKEAFKLEEDKQIVLLKQELELAKQTLDSQENQNTVIKERYKLVLKDLEESKELALQENDKFSSLEENLQREKVKLENLKQQHQETVSKLTETLSQLELKRNELEYVSNNLKSQISSVENTKKELEDLQGQHQTLTNKLKDSDNNTLEFSKTIDFLEDSKKTHLKEIEQYKSQLSSLEAQISDTQLCVQEHKDLCLQLHFQMDNKDYEIQNLQEKLANLAKINDDKLSKAQEEAASLRNHGEALSLEKQDLETTIKTTQAQYEETEAAHLSRCEQLKLQAIEKDQEIEKLVKIIEEFKSNNLTETEELERYRQLVIELKAEIEEQQNYLHKLRKDNSQYIEELSQQMQQHHSEKDQLGIQLEEAKTEFAQLNEVNLQAVNKLEHFKEQLEDSFKKLDIQKVLNNDKETEIANLLQQISTKQSLIDEMESYASKFKIMQTSRENGDNYSSFEEQLKFQDEEVKTLQNLLSEKDTLIETLQKEIADKEKDLTNYLVEQEDTSQELSFQDRLKLVVKQLSKQLDLKDQEVEEELAKMADKVQEHEDQMARQHRLHMISVQKELEEKASALEELEQYCQQLLEEKLNPKVKEVSDWDNGWEVEIPDAMVDSSCQVDWDLPPSPMDEALPQPLEYEYLRNIMLEYMMGKEPLVLAKVIAAVMRFPEDQTKVILEKEQSRLNLK